MQLLSLKCMQVEQYWRSRPIVLLERCALQQDFGPRLSPNSATIHRRPLMMCQSSGPNPSYPGATAFLPKVKKEIGKNVARVKGGEVEQTFVGFFSWISAGEENSKYVKIAGDMAHVDAEECGSKWPQLLLFISAKKKGEYWDCFLSKERY